MAIAVDQTSLGTNSGTGGTVVLTTSQAVASSGFAVLGVGWWDASVTLSGVSGGGLTWAIDKQGNAADPVFPHVAIVSAQAPSGLASSTAITATFSGTPAGENYIGGTSFTGVATSSPIDGTPLGPTGVATAAWSSGSYSIAAGSVIVAMCLVEAAVSNTPTSPSTEAWQRVGAGDAVALEYRIETSAGSYAVAGTWGSATKNTNVSVAYLVSAAVPQTLRPDADIVTTGWATAPLWSKIEESAADGTVITATAS